MKTQKNITIDQMKSILNYGTLTDLQDCEFLKMENHIKIF